MRPPPCPGTSRPARFDGERFVCPVCRRDGIRFYWSGGRRCVGRHLDWHFLGDLDTRLALIVATAPFPPTLDALSMSVGQPRTVVYGALQRLKNHGLLDWQPGRHGTLHPLVRIIPVTKAIP